MDARATPTASRGSAEAASFGAILRAFLKLGLTSFGGPIAHLGYFRNELVLRRGWLDEAAYGDLVALCQFLPGPASSQVGFSLGVVRGGLAGGLAAWLGFTLPSAVLLLAFAYGADRAVGPAAAGILHGLKLVAVAVVGQAVWGMARSLCPDRSRASIAVAAVVLVVLLPPAWGQIAAILAGGVIGLALGRTAAAAVSAPLPDRLARVLSRRWAILALAAFFLLLGGLPVASGLLPSHGLALFDAFYRAGALVFGGGHVVLPLLQAAVVAPGWVDPGAFLAGYGAAQAVPGPLFTVAAYLGGAMLQPPNGIAGAALCLAAIFLPGLLLVLGALPFWDELRRRRRAQAAMRGVNAAVVGLLAAALYNPLWTSTVLGPHDFVVALAGFVLLTVWRAPSWVVVILTALCGLGLAELGPPRL